MSSQYIHIKDQIVCVRDAGQQYIVAGKKFQFSTRIMMTPFKMEKQSSQNIKTTFSLSDCVFSFLFACSFIKEGDTHMYIFFQV